MAQKIRHFSVIRQQAAHNSEWVLRAGKQGRPGRGPSMSRLQLREETQAKPRDRPGLSKGVLCWEPKAAGKSGAGGETTAPRGPGQQEGPGREGLSPRLPRQRAPGAGGGGWGCPSAVVPSEANPKDCPEPTGEGLRAGRRRIKLFPGILIASQQKAEKRLKENPKKSNIR